MIWHDLKRLVSDGHVVASRVDMDGLVSLDKTRLGTKCLGWVGGGEKWIVNGVGWDRRYRVRFVKGTGQRRYGSARHRKWADAARLVKWNG